MVFYHAAEIRAVSDFSRDKPSGGGGGGGADRIPAGVRNCVTRSLFPASLCRPGLKCGAKEEAKGGPVKVTVKGAFVAADAPYAAFSQGEDDGVTGRIRGRAVIHTSGTRRYAGRLTLSTS